MTDEETTVHGAPDAGWRPSGRQIGVAVLVLLVAIFAAVNFEESKIDFIVESVRIPLFFVIVACGLLGFAAGYLFARHLDKRERERG